MIFLETYNKSQLEKLIHSEKFQHFPFLPITVHRAISHINNPNLEHDSTTLILAFENENLAGYIGVMADCIIHNEQKISVGWLSTLFVHPNFRGKKIAQQLLNKACDEYEGKILITEFTPEAESMYLKSKMFSYQTPLEGVSYHFFSNLQKILPTKNVKWNRISSILKLNDTAINFFAGFIYKSIVFKKNHYEIVNFIDSEIEQFIREHKKQNCFNRNFVEISWITKYPWVLSSINLEKRDYQFSDFDKRFEYIFIKIYENEILKTLLMLSVRNSNAKLHFTIGDYDPQVCSKILYQFVVKNKISNLICFDKNINKHFKSMIVLFRKQRIRKFLMHKNLLETLGQDFIFDISAGDGDAIFT